MKKLNPFPQACRVKLQPFVLLIHSTNLAARHSKDYPSWSPPHCHPNQARRSGTLLQSSLHKAKPHEQQARAPRA